MPMSRHSQRARSEAFLEGRSSEQVSQTSWMRENGQASPLVPLLLDARKWDLMLRKRKQGDQNLLPNLI